MNNLKLLNANPWLLLFIRSLYDIGGNTLGHVIRWMDENPQKVEELLKSKN
tara:strand:- start:1129 stop:1281 length:153 start_codon:yes stop_codon:yes gene_type:complete